MIGSGLSQRLKIMPREPTRVRWEPGFLHGPCTCPGVPTPLPLPVQFLPPRERSLFQVFVEDLPILIIIIILRFSSCFFFIKKSLLDFFKL